MEATSAPPVTGLGFCGFYFDDRGISHLYDEAPSFEQWQQAGVQLREIERHVQFWIGDWVNYGRARWGEQAEQGLAEDVEILAAEATGWKPATVEQYARVARQVAPERRDPALPFSVHREVADLPPDQQTAWLARTKAENLSSDRLRGALKAERTGDTACWIVVRCADEADREALRTRLAAEGREVKLP